MIPADDRSEDPGSTQGLDTAARPFLYSCLSTGHEDHLVELLSPVPFSFVGLFCLYAMCGGSPSSGPRLVN